MPWRSRSQLWLCLVLGGAFGAMRPATAGSLRPVSEPVPPNYILGTQEIYGGGHLYNYTTDPMLVEQRDALARLGANQMKIVLSSSKTCIGYDLRCNAVNASVVDLASLSAQPGLAAMLADPRMSWYHFWVESFANPNWQGRDWTAASLAAEYAETKAWAVHMLTSYSGTGKVFMAGNWEGDWVLLGASGCKLPGGKGYNFTCDPTPAVINRMVQWGKTRQRAIDDARTEAAAAGAANVTLLYYIEMNLGPESLPPGSAGCASTNAKEACTSKPGITNSVLKEVNPDLVSYSSYTATNAYASADDTSAVDALLVATLDHVQAQLSDKPATMGSHPLGFAKRVFIGEFGATPKMIPNTTFAGRYLARVYSAAIGWGVPMALYWELYSNNSTIPLVPAPGGGGEAMSRAVYLRLQAYFTAARRECGGLNSTQMQRWAAQYWKRQL